MISRIRTIFRFRKDNFKCALVAGGWMAVLLWALTAGAPPLIGKESRQKDKDQPPPAQKENRFLFIVDTSASMRANAVSVRQSVTDLLKSSMQGQMRDGDTIGLWNYEDELHTDFPMQIWSAENSPRICERVAAYLTDREYRKKARLDKVLPYVGRLIETSRLITIIFIYDGSQPMRGTPFDKDINDLQKQFLHDVRAADFPFVTILAAREGKVFEYTVNIPTAVVVPHTAEPVKEPATNAVATVAPPPPVPVVTNNVAPAPAPPPHFEIVMAGPRAHRTNSVPLDASTAPPAAAAPSSPPVDTTSPAANSPGAPATASEGTLTVVPPAPQASVTGEPPSQSAPAAVAPLTAVPQPVPAPTSSPSPPPSAAEPAPAPSTSPVASSPGGAALTIAGTSVSPPPSEPAPQSRQTPKADLPAASKPPPEVEENSSAKAVSSAEPNSPPAVLVPAPRSPVGPITATAITVPSTGDHIALLVIALSMLTIAVVLVVFLMRRSSRAGAHPSFISQSIDRSP